MNDKNLTLLLISLFNICLITTIIPQIPITAQINQASELSKDDNVISTIKPQGTSIGAQNDTSISKDNPQTTSAGNVTSTIKPQGTSIDKS